MYKSTIEANLLILYWQINKQKIANKYTVARQKKLMLNMCIWLQSDNMLKHEECNSQLSPLLQINYSENSILELVKDVKVQGSNRCL